MDTPDSPGNPYPNCTWTLSAHGLSGTVAVEVLDLNTLESKRKHGSIVLWQDYRAATSNGLYPAIVACVEKLENRIRQKPDHEEERRPKM